MMRWSFYAAVTALALWASPAQALFWDQGFVTGTVRSGFNDPNDKTSTKCPSCGCYPNCATPVDDTPWPNSNSYTNASPWPTSNFWVLAYNNETATNHSCNSGPQGQSLPVKILGLQNGVFSLSITNVTGGKKALLEVNNNFQTCGCSSSFDATPFFTLGADSRRGNGSVVGFLNKSNPNSNIRTTFIAAKPSSTLGSRFPTCPGQPVALLSYVYAIAQWDNKNHLLFVELSHQSDNPSWTGDHPAPQPPCPPYCEPVTDSFLYPGAELVYMTIEDTASGQTQLTSTEKTYTINWQDLFVNKTGVYWSTHPANAGQDLSILGVHWAPEITGQGSKLRISVRGMKMVP